MYQVFKSYLDSRASLTPEEHEHIQSVAIAKKLRKRQYLLQEGDVWKFHAFVAKGCVRTYSVDDKGLEHIMGFSIENWWTGDRESLTSGKPARYNIDAVEDTELILFTHDNFEKLCKDVPIFNDMVNAILHKSLLAAQSRIHAAISYSAEQKYLDFVSKYPGFANRIPQSMIASYLGMTPETLSRIRNLTAKK